MEPHDEQMSENQKASWNSFSAGWKKWESTLYDHMQPVADEMIRLLNPENSQHLLDLASGTGEPGLSFAKLLTNGKVTLTDLSGDMLAIARENAVKRRLQNIEFVVCNASELPFGDQTFDALTCRMGFMFFSDMPAAAEEMRRVLKTKGKFAISVWGTPEQNLWGTAIAETIRRNMKLQVPDPNAPGIFRCGKSGLMTDLFNKAGFKNISETEVACQLNCGSAEAYWQMMTEIAAPIVSALRNADARMKEKIKKEVCELITEKYPGGNVNINGTALVIYGEK